MRASRTSFARARAAAGIRVTLASLALASLPVAALAQVKQGNEISEDEAAAAAPAGTTEGAGAVTETAEAAELRDRFARATAAMAAGELDRAAEAFVAIAGDAPGSAHADDALFTAAKLYEEKLMQPARALALYRRLIAEYPDSRTVLAAERRAGAIAELLGSDSRAGESGATDPRAERALARFTDILQRFSQRGESQSLAMAEALVAEHPEWSGVPRVLLWIAGVHQRAGRWERALRFYLRAAEASRGEDETLFAAYRGAGDAELARGRFAAAERYYRRMPTGGDTARRHNRADALADVDTARLRAAIYEAAYMVVLAVVLALLASLRQAAGSLAVAWRVLIRPPTEVIYMAPVCAVLIAAALTAHYAIGPAVVIICAGGVILTWLSGAGLAAAILTQARHRRLRVLTHAVLTATGVLATCYIAIHHNRLIDMIVDTVRFGPDV